MTLEIHAWLRMCTTVLLGLMASGAMTLVATVAYSATPIVQENQSKEPPAQSKEQAELVDGLLDLLGEPDAEASGAESQKATAQAGAESPRVGDDGSSAAANFTGDAALTGNPLSMVHSSMRSAAERLGRGVVGPDTQKLQGDILHQLDALIEELQRQEPAESSPQPEQQSSTPQSQTSRMPTDEQSSSAGETPSDQSQSEGERQPDRGKADSGQGAQDRPSQAGGAAAVAVDLADPRRLQQDVWGQLPEQMRKQMQSRMVESFLPSYRPQIEAYFRKLLESESQ